MSWHRYASFIVARRWIILVFSFVLAVVSVWLASKLPLKSDFKDLLPPSAQSVRELRALEQRTYVPSTFMIGIECEDPQLRAKAVEALRPKLDALPRDLVDAPSYDDGIQYRYVWDHRFLFADLDQLQSALDAMDKKVIEDTGLGIIDDDDDTPKDANGAQPDAMKDLRKKLDDAKKQAQKPPERISKDGKLQLILIRSAAGSDDEEHSRRLIGLIDAALDQTRKEVPGVTLGMTGDAITSSAENRALLGGMFVSTVITVVLVIGALLIFYRTFLGVGALCWSLTVGTLLTFAFAKLSIGYLNIASAFLSSIVIGNGINFGILVLARYLEERRGGKTGVDAISGALSHTAPGTIAAAVAAFVAYGSLVITPFRGFRHFGIIGGVGMILCWISAYTLLPAAIAVVDRRVHVGKELPLGRWLQHLAPKRPMPVAIAGMVLLFVVGALAARYLLHDPFENNLANLRSHNEEIDASSKWMAKFDKAFGSGISGGFVIGTDSVDQAHLIADKLKAFDAGKPEKEKLFSHVATMDELLPKDQSKKLELLDEIRKRIDRTLMPRAKPDEKDELQELRPPDDLKLVTIDDIPRELAGPFIEKDGTRGRLVLANTGLGVDLWNVKSIQSFASTVKKMNLGPDVLVGGSAFVFSDMLDAMTHDGPRATIFSILGALLVVFVTVGRGRYALVTILCGTLGTLALLTVASFIGLKVNFLDFVALPITIGIGIDYAVNISSRARLEGGAAGRKAVATTGAAVTLCSYTTVVGYASLLFSVNQGIRSFGMSAMIGELTCITTALVFAPALIDVLASRKKA